MRQSFYLRAGLLLSLPLFGCDDAPAPVPEGNGPGADLGADLGPTPREQGMDGAPVFVDEGPPDARQIDPDAFEPPPGGEPCTFADECPFGDCIEGTCHNERPNRCMANGLADCEEGEVCGGFDQNYYCLLPCEIAGTCPLRTRPCNSSFECSPGSSCHGMRCTNNCQTDNDCGSRFCYDGQCLEYPDIWTGAAPTPFGTPGQLHAGVAVLPLDYPIGVELGGYGAREGPLSPESPYAFALGGSDRFFEAQDVRVVALSTDKDLLIFVRLPLCWSTDLILSNVAVRLQAITGVNYRDHIVTAATHSHSQPARFWTIVPETGFGVFGHGLFSKEILDRISESVAGAIHLALLDMQPARFGSAVIDNFDPDRRIHSDRRPESPDFLDDRMMVWRVDTLEGQPMAAVVNFALHGTHMQLPWVTGDAPAGVEVVLTQKLSAEFGKDVPVLFANGNAGNVSPRGDDGVEEPYARIQVVGHRTWPIFRDVFTSIDPAAELDLELITRRIPITYELIGYDRSVGDFRSTPDSAPLIYGGFQCVTSSRGPDEPDYQNGQYFCSIDLESFRGAPVPEFMKTTLSAFRLGDLVVSTLPGESTSELGRRLTGQVRDDAVAAGHPGRVAVNLGYSQDHHLYLLTAEDWVRGGYEAAQNVWGPKFGTYIASEARILAAELNTPEREVVDTGIKPTYYDFLIDDAVAPTSTMGLPGGVLQSPTGSTLRGALVSLRINGGHPGVDMPYAVLERQGDDGTFAPALRTGGGQPFDNTAFDVLTIYEGDYERDHTWAFSWELAFDLPLGRYRVRATGRYFDGASATPYDVVTPETFEVAPARLALRDATVDDGQIVVKVNYPNGPSTDDGVTPFAELSSRGHLFRGVADARYEGAEKRYALILGAPLSTDQTVQVALSGPVQVETTVQPAADRVNFDLVTSRAADGTVGTTPIRDIASSRLSIAPPPPGDYRLTVTDAWGNVGETAVSHP